MLSFDLRDFLSNCKASKPPYRCPVESCGKTYRSLSGIQQHLQQAHSEDASQSKRPIFSNPNPMFYNDDSSDGNTNNSSHQLLGTRENLTYAEAQRMIEVEIDGRIHRINIAEPMGIVCLDHSNQTNGKPIEMSNGDVAHDSVLDTGERKHRRKENGKNKQAIGSNKNRSVPTGQNLQSIVSEPINGTIKLPEPSFRLLTDRQVCRAPPRPLAYFRYIDKSPEELDEQIEYDMDEEDFSWLELINKKRRKDNLAIIPPDTFELLMDRLEKECYFMNEKNGQGDYYSNQAIDEDAVCCICNDGECQNSNAILFCDMCDLPVHQECYGVPYIPEGQWLCRRCLQSPSRSVDCILCPNRGGAFKQTDDGRWCHVVCALWVPEVCFSNLVFLEPIDSISAIPTARWKLICYICKQKNAGACIQCHKSNCYTAFHVTCAQQAGLHMRMEAVREFNGSTVNTYIRKEAYCDAHMPVERVATNGTTMKNGRKSLESSTKSCNNEEEDEEKEEEDDEEDEDKEDSDSSDAEEGDEDEEEEDDEEEIGRSKRKLNSKKSCQKSKRNNHSGFKENKSFDYANLSQKKEIKAKMKKARKILAEKRSACPTVAIPTIPAERLTEIAQLINIPKRNQFLQRLLGYWTLKRESRNGVPLLRRLQLSNGNNLNFRTSRRKKVEPEEFIDQENDAETLRLKAELKELQRLRQDLERARILIELIRKREKVKRESIRNLEQRIKLQIEPFKMFLHCVLSLLKAKDTNGFFLDPVDINEVPDYLYFIKNPMSFSDIQQKIDSHLYISFDQFEADFNQIIENCTSYNEKPTVFYKAAIKLRDAGKGILKIAREKLQQIQIDPVGGILKSLECLDNVDADSDVAPKLSKKDDQKDDPESPRKELRNRLTTNDYDDLPRSSAITTVTTDQHATANDGDISIFRMDHSPRRSVSKSKCISPLKMILNKKPDSPLLTLLTQKQKKPTVASHSPTPVPAVKARKACSSSSKSRLSKSSANSNTKQITSYFNVISQSDAIADSCANEKRDSSDSDVELLADPSVEVDSDDHSSQKSHDLMGQGGDDSSTLDSSERRRRKRAR